MGATIRFLLDRFKIWQKGGLLCDFENFNFLHLEIQRTHEKPEPVHSGVVGVTVAKAGSVIVGVCAAVIGNTNIAKGPFPRFQS
jgi:hypothetical protein